MSKLRLLVLASSLRQLPLYFQICRLVLTDFLVPGFHRKSADWKQIRFRFLIRQHERARLRISFPFPVFQFSNNVLIHLRQAMEYFWKITNSIISEFPCPTVSATPISVVGPIPMIGDGFTNDKGPSINYVVSGGRRGQKLPILRQHTIWTAPKSK